jgi:hypothetical protein
LSLAAVPGILTGIGKAAGYGAIAYEGVRKLGGALGLGGGDQNIARSFSKGLGCEILQSDKAQAQAYIQSGVNPCTGAPLSPAQAAARGVQGTSQAEMYQAAIGGPTALPGGGMSVQQAGMGGALVRAGGRALSLSPGILRTTTGRISSVVLPSGQKFSAKKAASLIRRVGLEAAAAALGIGLVQVAEVLLTTQPTRRRRGISYAQLRNAKRVACTVSRMARDLQVKPAPTRRRSCR